MVATRKDALEIAQQVKKGLEEIYGRRLKAVYLYGSAARDELTPDSDIDIAVILDQIPDRFAEHERVSRLGSRISLEYNTLVSFMFANEDDFEKGRFAIHRAIKLEGVPA